jgi:hypothetical protein
MTTLSSRHLPSIRGLPQGRRQITVPLRIV